MKMNVMKKTKFSILEVTVSDDHNVLADDDKSLERGSWRYVGALPLHCALLKNGKTVR
jgi:hypothetical protein